jgi:hypothetical protein
MPTNNNDIPYKSGISVYGNREEAYFDQHQADDDENDDDFNEAPKSDMMGTVAKLLGKALQRLTSYEPLMQSAEAAPKEVDATPKRFKDYLQEFLVTDSTWKAPKQERTQLATHVVQQALPEALIADTTNQHVSPFVREFMLKDHISLAAVQMPEPQTPTKEAPSTRGVATPLERQQQQGRQWFASEAMQTQAPQALEAYQNPPQHRLIASAETETKQYDVQPQYTAIAYNPPAPSRTKEPVYKGSISVTEVIKATGLGSYPAVLNGVFGYRGNVLTSQQLAKKIQQSTYEEKRTLQLAKELNNILVQNEQKGAYRDDAWATAQGIQCIASYNTYNGKLNLEGFRKHLMLFFVDQKQDNSETAKRGKELADANVSPLASSLFGRERSKAYGWRPDLWDEGNIGTNQAHHLATYISVSIKYGMAGSVVAMGAAKVADGDNPPDYLLSKVGQNIGQKLFYGQINPNQLGNAVYERIRQK